MVASSLYCLTSIHLEFGTPECSMDKSHNASNCVSISRYFRQIYLPFESILFLLLNI